jgi:hypothetical protein
MIEQSRKARRAPDASRCATHDAAALSASTVSRGPTGQG